MGYDDSGGTQLRVHIGQMFRSKPVRLASAALVICIIIFVLYGSTRNGTTLSFEYSRYLSFSKSSSSASLNWSRYAYTQYVTNTPYLCNSVMLFETLHRLGSKADRLMMYPAAMHPDPASSSVESRLLLKAQNEYGVKLMPIEVQHRPGRDRKDLLSIHGSCVTKLTASDSYMG
jgi:hypothetical protein